MRDVEILPGVVLGLVIGIWELVSLQEDALGDARVLNLRFNDVDCVIIQVVVDNAFADSEVFIWVFNNWFLEVGIEFEDLKAELVRDQVFIFALNFKLKNINTKKWLTKLKTANVKMARNEILNLPIYHISTTWVLSLEWRHFLGPSLLGLHQDCLPYLLSWIREVQGPHSHAYW